jgi:hypothetical protein
MTQHQLTDTQKNWLNRQNAKKHNPLCSKYAQHKNELFLKEHRLFGK